MPRIPLPRRSLRSLCVLVFLPLLGVFIVVSSYDLIATSEATGRHGVRHPGYRPASTKDRIPSIDDYVYDDGTLDDDWSIQEDRDPAARRGFSNVVAKGAQVVQDARQALLGNAAKGTRDRQGTNGGATALAGAAAKVDRAVHQIGKDGILRVNPKGRHPIWELIQKGRAEWEAKKAKQSTTLEQAVRTYQARYSRNPPKGFDKWWAYVQENNVQMPDEYDKIFEDLEPFHALRPKTLRELQSHWETIRGTYVISCPSASKRSRSIKPSESIPHDVFKQYPAPEEGGCYLAQSSWDDATGEGETGRARSGQQLELLEDIEALLADVLDEELRVTFYMHDVPFQFVGHEYRSALEDSVAVGEYYNPADHSFDLAHIGWASACGHHQPLRQSYNPEVLPDVDSFWSEKHQKTFIWDHKQAMDPCIHPSLTHLTGFLASFGKGPGPSTEMFPILAMCTTHLHSDVLTVAYEQFTDDVGDDPEWEDKTDERLLWRGSTTGILFDDGLPWNISQRVRLVSQAEAHYGAIPLLSPGGGPNAPVGEPELVPVGPLNDLLLDVAFVGSPIQCAKQEICDQVEQMFEFRKRQDWSKANNYKYIFDIDGNGWSSRFKRLMSTNSLVLKSTIFPEWYADRIQAWVHYVPVKADLTDLYDIMAFFRGSDATGEDGHHALAKEIATAGKNWSYSYWRKEDVVAYVFRLYLEYARLMAPDREAFTYTYTKG